MTDKLSERMTGVSVRAHVGANLPISMEQIVEWAIDAAALEARIERLEEAAHDLAKRLEKSEARCERLEGLARDLWTDVFTGHFRNEQGPARMLASWQELGEALQEEVNDAS